MRKKILAGNWKMNLLYDEAISLAQDVRQNLPDTRPEVILAPAYPYLAAVNEEVRSQGRIRVAAQDMSMHRQGAYTGEVCVGMLKSTGVYTVIIGHSERRKYHRETGEVLRQKVDLALEEDMQVIFCVGESLDDRQSGKHREVVQKQLQESLFHLPKESWEKLIIAYEPVWAIGTGQTATPEQAGEMHHYIRGMISGVYDDTTAENTSILYGGSVKPSNAGELFRYPDIDGGLVGGASLKAGDFIRLVELLDESY